MIVKWLVVGDLHLDTKAPSRRRVDNYEEACFDKLKQILSIAVYNDISTVICTGDWFHRKNPSQVPHRLVRRTLDWLAHARACKVNIITVPGNHDVWYGDTSQNNLLRHPFGVLQTAPNFYTLTEGRYYLSDVTKGQGIVVSGAAYHKPYVLAGGVLKEDINQYDAPSGYEGYFQIHVVHGNTYSTPPNWEPYTLMADAAAFSRADIIHCGHIHDDLGTHTFTNKLGKLCIVTNSGSLTRGALNDESRSRVPKILEMQYDDVTKRTHWQEHLLEVAPADQIYALEEADREKEESSQISKWTDNLRSQLAEEDPEEDIEATIRQSSLDHRARELALTILNECE